MTKYCCNTKNKDLPLLADFLRVISEENRLKIICFLRRSDEQCVCKIQDFLGLSQNLVSHHLKVLRDFSLLNYRKVGLNVYYSINEKIFVKNKDLLYKILGDEK